MSMPNIRVTKKFVRIISLATAIMVGIGVFQFIYSPNESTIRANKLKAADWVTYLDGAQIVLTEYQTLRQQLRAELARKGIENPERWLISSNEELEEKITQSIKKHSATLIDFHCLDPESNNEKKTKWKFEFACDLFHLFQILNDLDHLPSNVELFRFDLDESQGEKLCRASVELQLDLEHVENNLVEKDILKP